MSVRPADQASQSQQPQGKPPLSPKTETPSHLMEILDDSSETKSTSDGSITEEESAPTEDVKQSDVLKEETTPIDFRPRESGWNKAKSDVKMGLLVAFSSPLALLGKIVKPPEKAVREARPDVKGMEARISKKDAEYKQLKTAHDLASNFLYTTNKPKLDDVIASLSKLNPQIRPPWTEQKIETETKSCETQMKQAEKDLKELRQERGILRHPIGQQELAKSLGKPLDSALQYFRTKK